jgi:hypothetical protein
VDRAPFLVLEYSLRCTLSGNANRSGSCVVRPLDLWQGECCDWQETSCY